MALARCEQHGHPQGKKGNVYLQNPLLPIGYPDTGVVCGLTGCDNPAQIWIAGSELAAYDDGDRVFGFANNTVKVRVR